jgi:hypothetical protein
MLWPELTHFCNRKPRYTLLQFCDEMVAFRCYDPSADGTGGIHIWYQAQLPAVRSAIDAALELMSGEAILGAPSIQAVAGQILGFGRDQNRTRYQAECKGGENPRADIGSTRASNCQLYSAHWFPEEGRP